MIYRDSKYHIIGDMMSRLTSDLPTSAILICHYTTNFLVYVQRAQRKQNEHIHNTVLLLKE